MRLMRRALVALLAIGLVGALAAASASAAPGDPDPTFGGGTGEVTFDPRGLPEARVSAVAIQPDGKILVAGSAGSNYDLGNDHDMIVMRFDPDGTPDSTFGLGGVASIDFSEGTTSNSGVVTGMVLQPNGKIVVTGQVHKGEEDYGYVARLNTNGTLDETFGAGNGEDSVEGGKLLIRLGIGGSGGTGYAGSTYPEALVVRPDGRLVVIGYSGYQYTPPSQPIGDFFALGLTAEGARDTSFGDYGRVFGEFEGGAAQPRAAALASNGDLILAGDDFEGEVEYPAVVRISPSGVLVSGFGEGGEQIITGAGTGQFDAMAVQPDGKLVFATTISANEHESSRAGLIRLNADGSEDSLGGHAFQPLPWPGGYDFAGGVAIDPQGRIVLTADNEYSDEARSVIERTARFTPEGALDPTFGNGGVAEELVGHSFNGHGFGTPLPALQADGKIVLAGTRELKFQVRRLIGGSPAVPPPPAGPGSTPPSETPPTKHFSRPKIGKATINPKKREATFTFSGGGTSSYQCALVKSAKGKKHHAAKPTFTACHSPQSYKHLGPGKYRFEVRPAGDASGADVAGKGFKIG